MPAAIKPVLPEVKVPPIPVSAEELAANPNAQAMADFNTAMEAVAEAVIDEVPDGMEKLDLLNEYLNKYSEGALPVNDNASYLLAEQVSKFLHELKYPLTISNESTSANLLLKALHGHLHSSLDTRNVGYGAEKTITEENKSTLDGIITTEELGVATYQESPVTAISAQLDTTSRQQDAVEMLDSQLKSLDVCYPNDKPADFAEVKSKIDMAKQTAIYKNDVLTLDTLTDTFATELQEVVDGNFIEEDLEVMTDRIAGREQLVADITLNCPAFKDKLNEKKVTMIQQNISFMTLIDKDSPLHKALAAENAAYNSTLPKEGLSFGDDSQLIKTGKKFIDTTSAKVAQNAEALQAEINDYQGGASDNLIRLLGELRNSVDALADSQLDIHEVLKNKRKDAYDNAVTEYKAYANMVASIIDREDYTPPEIKVNKSVSTHKDDITPLLLSSCKTFELKYAKSPDNPLSGIIKGLNKWLADNKSNISSGKMKKTEVASKLLETGKSAVKAAPHYYFTAKLLQFIDKWIKTLAPQTKTSVESTLFLNNFLKRLETQEKSTNKDQAIKQAAEELGPQRSGPGSRPSR